MCLTGNGTTFGLADGPTETAPTSIGRVIKISGMGIEVEDIEDSDLSTTGLMEYCFGDILTHDPLTMGTVFDPNIQVPIGLNNLGKVYVGTLTFPLQPGQTTPASITGSGALKKAMFGDLENNIRNEGELVWRFDNKSTPFAFTPAVNA